MEINPYESRLRMLQQIDTIAMQREAAPDEETAGCPGCPYFWTCPVPHRGEEVRAPEELSVADVADALPPRRAFTPRDESDIGWTDVWLDEDGLRIDPEELDSPSSEEAAVSSEEATLALDGIGRQGAGARRGDSERSPASPVTAPSAEGRRRRRLFRRRG
jgi:hypothetical protein